MDHLYTNEEGRTLIEILVSIVIISIVVIPFLSVFIQTTKSINHSDTILDATYFAQTHMEDIHNISETYTFDEAISFLNTDSKYSLISNNETSYNILIETDKYFGEIEIQKVNDSNLTQIVISIYEDNSKNKLEAKMENYVTWES
ncbi:prepilin-type N-terminal cleavage/methylation domain-containing protein [Salipaludibacillus sp. HK11]|uniref:prepilin-type N-terminal cleavage/methylation domain-containing protein n=1 Tax=Salipaludibacillus sp. HK11 TaxID=3394320 RepID=UPI0039FD0F3E